MSKKKSQKKVSKNKEAKAPIEDKKTKKSVTKKVKPPKKEKNQKEAKSEKRVNNQKLKGALLVLIGALLLLGAGKLLYERLIRPTNLSHYLPQEDTFAFFEVDISNPASSELYEHLSKYPVYQKENLISQINAFLNVDYQQQIEPWLGRQIGIGLLKKTSPAVASFEANDSISPVAFIEVKNFNQALNFLQSQKLADGKDALQITEFEGESLYQYTTGQEIYIAFLDDYMVAGLEPGIVKSIITSAKNGEDTLNDSEKYQKIASNLPSQNIAFGYFDVKELTDFILNSPNLVAKNGFILTTFEPFLSVFDAEGFTLTYDNQNLQMQTFTSMNKQLLEGKEFLTFKEKYNADLAEFASDDAIVVWGGMNLEKQLKRIADILGKGNEASMTIFEGLLEAQKNIYFGQDVSLDQDIYPLINKEFLLAIYDAETPQMQLVLSLDDEANSADKVRKIVDGFVKENAVFKPEVREVKLEDGTVGQEIVGVPEEIITDESEFKGQKIFNITLGSKSWGIHWFVKDSKLFLATQRDLIEKMIDGPQNSLASSELFDSNIKPILRHADEVSYLNLQKFLPHFWPTVEDGGSSIMELYTDPFKAISSGKNYFDDGISTIHNIALK